MQMAHYPILCVQYWYIYSVVYTDRHTELQIISKRIKYFLNENDSIILVFRRKFPTEESQPDLANGAVSKINKFSSLSRIKSRIRMQDGQKRETFYAYYIPLFKTLLVTTCKSWASNMLCQLMKIMLCTKKNLLHLQYFQVTFVCRSLFEMYYFILIICVL